MRIRVAPAHQRERPGLERDPRLGYDAHVMRWLIGPCMVLGMMLAVMLAATSLPADDGEVAADLARARARLVDSTREYRASLERLLVLQEAAARRAGDTAVKRRLLHEQGFVSRGELDESARSAEAARDRVDETQRRLAETEGVLAETLAAIEVAKAAAGAIDVVTTPAAIGGRGDAELSTAVVRDLDRFFVARFARSLPVSALGQTSVHDRLGLDHRHALDLAVHPDSEEGRAVIEYLQRHHIPFLAFRGVVHGASTGAHLHVGRTSPGVVPVSVVPR